MYAPSIVVFLVTILLLDGILIDADVQEDKEVTTKHHIKTKEELDFLKLKREGERGVKTGESLNTTVLAHRYGRLPPLKSWEEEHQPSEAWDTGDDRRLFYKTKHYQEQMYWRVSTEMAAIPKFKVGVDLWTRENVYGPAGKMTFEPAVDFVGWQQDLDPQAEIPRQNYGLLAVPKDTRKRFTLTATQAFEVNMIVIATRGPLSVAMDNAISNLNCTEVHTSDPIAGNQAYGTLIVVPKVKGTKMSFVPGQEVIEFNVEHKAATSSWIDTKEAFAKADKLGIVVNLSKTGFACLRELGNTRVSASAQVLPGPEAPHHRSVDTLLVRIYVMGPGRLSVRTRLGRARVFAGSTVAVGLTNAYDTDGETLHTLECYSTFCSGYAVTGVIPEASVVFMDPFITVVGTGTTGYVVYDTQLGVDVLAASDGLSYSEPNNSLMFWSSVGDRYAIVDVNAPSATYG